MTTRRVPGGTRSLTGILDNPAPLIDRVRGRVEAVVEQTTSRIVRDARAAAPVRSGALRDGLVDRAEPGPPDQIRRSVGVTGSAGAYARFVISSKIGERKHASKRPPSAPQKQPHARRKNKPTPPARPVKVWLSSPD